MMLAAKYADWWNLPDANFVDYESRVAALHRHCASIDRDPETLRLTWFGRLVLGSTQEEALRRGGGQWTPLNALVGTPVQVLEQIQPFLDLGTDYFMVEIPDVDQPDVRAMLLEELMPNVSQGR